MKAKKTIGIIAIILILAWGCTSNKQSNKLQPGYYQFSKTEFTNTGNIKMPQTLSFQSGIIHVINNDSLEFPGQKTLGEFLWGHSPFNYKIRGKRIILTNGDFKKRVKFEITPDNYLKLETNAENMTNVYFEPLPVKLAGKYRVFGFMQKESAVDDDILTVAKNVFRKESFNFISNNNVIIQPNLAQIITGNEVTTDTLFNYTINDTDITFSNSVQSVKVPYIFDGTFRLTINNSNFERLDIGEIEG